MANKLSQQGYYPGLQWVSPNFFDAYALLSRRNYTNFEGGCDFLHSQFQKVVLKDETSVMILHMGSVLVMLILEDSAVPSIDYWFFEENAGIPLP